MRAVWSPAAFAQFEAILDSIGAENPAAAERWGGKLLAATEKLAAFRHSGRVIPEYDDEILREWILGKYRLAYFVRAVGTEIAAIWHGARRPPGRGIRGEIEDE